MALQPPSDLQPDHLNARYRVGATVALALQLLDHERCTVEECNDAVLGVVSSFRDETRQRIAVFETLLSQAGR